MKGWQVGKSISHYPIPAHGSAREEAPAARLAQIAHAQKLHKQSCGPELIQKGETVFVLGCRIKVLAEEDSDIFFPV